MTEMSLCWKKKSENDVSGFDETSEQSVSPISPQTGVTDSGFSLNLDCLNFGTLNFGTLTYVNRTVMLRSAFEKSKNIEFTCLNCFPFP